ncbi:MAG TPA: glycerate kinase [Ornithinibacter sp.]|nr:glycerate kinase [Ornithinibacter sp.]
MRTVVVASDAFKGSASSLEVADAVRLGVLDVAPGARVVVVPVADGGEGTVAAALAAGWSPLAVEVHGPTGDPVTATLAVEPAPGAVSPGLGTAAPPHSSADSTAPPPHSSAESLHQATLEEGAPRGAVLVELADACGLGRLPGGVPAPLTASSRGLGDAILAALDLGAAELVVGVGGSASTDGGAGMLAALGARLLDADGHDLLDGGVALTGLHRLDLSGLDPRLRSSRLVLAADVDSPLLGPTGAAAVFGPQKGATPHDVQLLEAALTHWADVVASTPGASSTNRSNVPQPHQQEEGGGATSTCWSKVAHGRPDAAPGAGAAGGVGFALLAVLGAEHRSGVDVVLDLVGLDAALAGADLVVTGEGSLDAQTAAGKAVRGVARRAAAHGIPVVAVCGRLTLDDRGLAGLGVRTAYPLSDLEPDPQRSVTHAAELLRRTGRRIALEWLNP